MNKRYMPVVMVFMLGLSLLVSCIEDPGEDNNAIIDCIEGMEDALNTADLASFLSYFDESCNWINTFSQPDLDALYNLGEYNFHIYNIDALNTIASVACTATVYDPDPIDYPTTFEMVKTGDIWYIKSWYEDSTLMFYNYTPPQ